MDDRRRRAIKEERARCALANLRQATRAVTQMYDEAIARTGLRSTQFTLLVAVLDAVRPTIGELAEEMVMDRTTLTRNLRVLERQGFLRVEQGSDDQRKRRVGMTHKGVEAVLRAAPLRARAQRRVVQHLGQARFGDLLGSLGEIVGLSRSS